MTAPIGGLNPPPSYLLTATGMANATTTTTTGPTVSTSAPNSGPAVAFTPSEQLQNAQVQQDGILLGTLSPTAPGADPLYGQDTFNATAYTQAVAYDMYTSAGTSTALTQWLTTGTLPTQG